MDYTKDTSTYVDFGCADGALLSAMQAIDPHKVYVGYDNSPKQLNILKSLHPFLIAHSDWDAISSFVKRKDATLILSSVIHEVYSYSDPLEISTFWDHVFQSNFKYIAIRDMSISAKNRGEIIDLADVNKIRGHAQYTEMVQEFEAKWGSLIHGDNYLHFLLKFPYRDNWLRELNENYLSICTETLLERVPANYRIVYSEHAQLPYMRWKVKETFGIDMKFPSHIKLLIERK
jgi:hypothetical protein